jgi:hypothetical protein
MWEARCNTTIREEVKNKSRRRSEEEEEPL